MPGVSEGEGYRNLTKEKKGEIRSKIKRRLSVESLHQIRKGIYGVMTDTVPRTFPAPTFLTLI